MVKQKTKQKSDSFLDPSMLTVIGCGIIGSLVGAGMTMLESLSRPKEPFVYIKQDPNMLTLMNGFAQHKVCNPEVYEEIVNLVENIVQVYLVSLSDRIDQNDVCRMNRLLFALQQKFGKFYHDVIRQPDHLTDYESDSTQIIQACEAYGNNMILSMQDSLLRL